MISAARASRSVERWALAAVIVGLGLLFRPPTTQAQTPPSAGLVPWLGASSPGARALTGGLAQLRARGSRMIRVPASAFFMGSTTPEIEEAAALCQREPLAERCGEQTFADELSLHHVRLSGYFLDRMEVTVAEYDACVRLGRCAAASYERGAARFKRPEFPVTRVSWDDARAFCAFRGARLPTEAEFERAARGLTGRRYPWGNVPNGHLANHGRLGLDESDPSDGFAELAPSGSFPDGRTPDGFLDLAGNAAEWVQDRYAEQYPETDARDPSGPDAVSASGLRVVRGGSFTSALPRIRGAARAAQPPNTREPWLGFRCARSRLEQAP